MECICRCVSVQKYGNAPDENDDAVCAASSRLPFYDGSIVSHIAVADGATTASYSQEWADVLVEAYAESLTPTIDVMPENALVQLRLRWHRRVDARLAGKKLPWYAEETRNRGAAATLLGLTITIPPTLPRISPHLESTSDNAEAAMPIDTPTATDASGSHLIETREVDSIDRNLDASTEAAVEPPELAPPAEGSAEVAATVEVDARDDPSLKEAGPVTLAELDSEAVHETVVIGQASPYWNALAVGDSYLFLVRGNRLALTFPSTESDTFGNTPHLLLTNEVMARTEPVTLVMQPNTECYQGDTFYLATDALAAWFLTESKAGREPWGQLDEIFRPSDQETQDAFGEFVSRLQETKAIRNDDVTLVRVSML